MFCQQAVTVGRRMPAVTALLTSTRGGGLRFASSSNHSFARPGGHQARIGLATTEAGSEFDQHAPQWDTPRHSHLIEPGDLAAASAMTLQTRTPETQDQSTGFLAFRFDC